MTALAMAGCGSSAAVHRTQTAADSTPTPQGHPQVVEPVAGDIGASHAGGQVGTPSKDPVPTGPATNTKTPAKGAPTDAEVRAAIARFQAAIARYHLDQLNLSGSLINPPPGQYNVSIASVFTDYGQPVACGGVEQVAELGVANKTLPCGTEVIFVYGNKAIKVPVIDRGPYIAGRDWDLTGAAAEALNFPGLGYIYWRLA
jgi:rare lipoprotein A (peptidoglycan hydrolase)